MSAANEKSPSKAIQIAIWMAQVLLFLAFGMAGVMKSTMPIAELSKTMAWVGRLPPGLVRFIGGAELSGALGLLLPSLTRIRPGLTPLAAAGLLTIQVLAAGHHLMNGEASLVPINLVFGSMAAFIVWGRWKRAPITPRT